MTESLAARVRSGDLRALARAISLVEDDTPAGAALVRELFPHTGRAFLVGVTGPPGAGKSTLVDGLIRLARAQGRSVGVVAVDPTSPFTGGAILGDRVRMQAHAGDTGVFIRSMATRGRLGGLSRGTSEAALVMDAAGRDLVIIETVGVGQDEVDIVRTADVSVVALVPGTGDDVQALKAGIMEIADIFVVNKADREGAGRMAAAIEAALSLHTYEAGEWRPPVLLTEATTGRGLPELVEAIAQFRAHTSAELHARRASRAAWRVRELLAERFVRHVEATTLRGGELATLTERIAAREIDPYTAVDEILEDTLGDTSTGGTAGAVTESRPRDVRPVLDHVGIAVADVEAAIAFYRDALGLEFDAPEDVASQRVRAHFVPAGGAALELLEGTAEDSPITRFVAKRGPGLHHITLRVGDILAALARLKALGVRLIDEAPRPGAHGSLVAFIHPASAHGVLVELKQAHGSGLRTQGRAQGSLAHGTETQAAPPSGLGGDD